MSIETTAGGPDIYTGTPAGRNVARNQAAMRKRQGPGLLVYNGQKFNCTSKAEEVNTQGGPLLASGSGNAAFADTRTIMTDPGIFMEGAAVKFAGKPYTISSVPAPQIRFGTAVAQRLILTRAAPPASATAETPEEATASGHPEDAGKRVNYRPKSATG